MDKIAFLDFLYYKIGRQATDFQLQAQEKEGFMSKRRTYSNIGFSKDMYWLNKVNARTLLKNEVVLDLDPEKGESKEEFDARITKTIEESAKEDSQYYWVVKSNRGVHIHLIFKQMFSISDKQRIEFRKMLLKKYQADQIKHSDNVTINLEWSNHWKSGKKDEIIKQRGLEEIG